LRDGNGNVALGSLPGRTQNSFVLVVFEPNPGDTVDDSGDCRDCAVGSDCGGASVQSFFVGRRGQTEVAEDGALQADDWIVVVQCLLDFVAQFEVGHHILLDISAAAGTGAA
jgi:hypothetical protein